MSEWGTNSKFWSAAADLLQAAGKDSSLPFALPALCTVGSDGIPRPRKVVLRSVNPTATILRFYTDVRSVKASHLATGSEGSYLFWDPEQKIQLMAGGTTNWTSAAEARRVFMAMPKHARKAYATVQAPGTRLPHPASGLPADWESRSTPETDYAGNHFGILVTTLRWADLLHLDRGGNTRMTGTRSSEGAWKWEWVVP